MDNRKIEMFIRGIKFMKERDRERCGKLIEEGSIGAAILFLMPICFHIALVNEPAEVEEAKRLISGRLSNLQWEFNIIDSLPSIEAREDIKILDEGVKKTIICVIDEIAYENWRKSEEGHGYLSRSNMDFFLCRSHISRLV